MSTTFHLSATKSLTQYSENNSNESQMNLQATQFVGLKIPTIPDILHSEMN
jgi:hypothetical protein